ncbi:MAG: META domain-containing protein [Desulfuromonadales bacterium]
MNVNTRIFLIAVTFVLTATSLTLASPSFDCSKAAGEVEQLVCRDQSLANLDQELSEVYESAMKRLPTNEHAKTRAMQRGWIKGRNDCWKAEDVRGCVEVSYQVRIVELQITGGLLMAPDYTTLICNQQQNIPFTTVFYNQTNPPSVVLTWGSDQVIAFIQRSGSGAHYAAPGVDFWSHQGESRVDWFGTELLCLPHGGATTDHPGEALSLEPLRNATYHGFDDIATITLQDGRWEGEPYVVGGATLPQAQMLEELYISGDLNQDGRSETAVLINYAPGGTGDFLYLALVQEQEGLPVNIATAPVGDRTRVRDFVIKGKEILLDLIQAGPEDGMCCPGDVVTRAWTFDGQRLEEQPLEQAAERLSPALLAGQSWQLKRWRHEEPIVSPAPITLTYENGTLSGHAGCNRYFASIKGGSTPGDVTIAEIGTTRMSCADSTITAAEQKFLEQLLQVTQLSWYAGSMTLAYGQGQDSGVMYFDAIPGGTLH